jgi:hypothetical protein
MGHNCGAYVLIMGGLYSFACGGTATTPSPQPTDTITTITFSPLIDHASTCAVPPIPPSPLCGITEYSELGFRVATLAGDWSVRTDYGNPAPFIEFWASAGTTVGAELLITSQTSATFHFRSIDLYSSDAQIPYTIKGLRNSQTVFGLVDTLPNPTGAFRTISNQGDGDLIDTLSIAVTDSAASCCRNPMGIDNIVLTRAGS